MPVTSPIMCFVMIVFIVAISAFASHESRLGYKIVIPFLHKQTRIFKFHYISQKHFFVRGRQTMFASGRHSLKPKVFRVLGSTILSWETYTDSPITPTVVTNLFWGDCDFHRTWFGFFNLIYSLCILLFWLLFCNSVFRINGIVFWNLPFNFCNKLKTNSDRVISKRISRKQFCSVLIVWGRIVSW